MNLKPQDVVILLKLHLIESTGWSYPMLADALSMSASEVHAGIQRAQAARLVDIQKRVITKSFEEFLIHGVKYAYPPTRGGLTRGMPTGVAVPPLSSMLAKSNSDPPVWPHPEGQIRGYEFSPLYKSVPEAAAKDECLYQLLALVDVIRDGRARETELAVRELKSRLSVV